MAGTEELIDELSDLALFADLARPELAGVAHTLEEEWYADGQRILREGFSGTGFYILLEGEVAVRIEGQERARLRPGRFFGRAALRAGGPAGARGGAGGPGGLRPGARPALDGFPMRHPNVMFRML